MGKLFSKSKTKQSRYSGPGEGGDVRHRNPNENYGNQRHIQPENIVQQFNPAHSAAVTSLAPVAPGLLLSGSKDESLALYNYTDGKVQQRWTGHQKEVTKVTYGSKVSAVFSASRDKTAKMWSLTNGNVLQSFDGHDLVVTGLSLNNENSLLCTGSRDNTIKLWDLESGSSILENTVSRNLITHIKWSQSADIIAQTSEDKEVRIWDSRNLQVVQSFPRKQYIQMCCDISSDNVYCLTCSNGFGGAGCEATLWDLRTTKPVCEYKGHVETINACIFLPPGADGKSNLLATSSSDCSVMIWDQDTKENVCSTILPVSGPLTSLVAYDDGSICVGSFNTGIYVLALRRDIAGNYELVRKCQF